MKTRKAVFSGSWYPAYAGECETEIKRFIEPSGDRAITNNTCLGGIVPHAGWYFSGEIACKVIHRLLKDPCPDVVVVFGMHLHPASPNYIMVEGAWETPFGALEVQTDLALSLNDAFNFEIETASHHTQDNTIELQLPFIKYFCEDVKIVPMGVPPVDTSLEIGEAVVDFSTTLGLRAVIIGSTDLTHYGFNYGFSPKGSGADALKWVKEENDRKVVDAMLALDPEGVIQEGVSNQNACCAGAAATAIAASKKLGATGAFEVAYATSYDKSPGESFVGYTGILFS